MKLIVTITVAILMCSPRIAGTVCVQGDCTNGYGTAVLPDGNNYVGEFREGIRTGWGSMTYPDGIKYVGNWQNDKPHGKGTLLSVDKFEYTGEFANGVRHGQGTLKIAGGNTYVGQWQDDVPHGQGKLTDPGREEFVGQFEDGRRNGQGEALYADGSRYNGQWADDLPNGQGVKILADGMQYSGQFKNGLMYGSGTIVMPDGNQLKIKWQTDLPIPKEADLSDTAVSVDEDEKDWYMVTVLGKAQKPLSLEPHASAGYTDVSSQQSAAAAGGIPPQEPGVSAATPEQVSPQASTKKEVDVVEKAQTETTTESQLAEALKTKQEAAITAEKEDGSEPEVAFPQNPESKKAVEFASIAAGANIRSDASLTSEVLRTVPPGYPVAVLEKRADWFLIEDFRERKGWVFASLVTEPGTVIIRVFKGNLRSGPSFKDDIIGQLDHGTVMSVLERSGEWLKVSDSEELSGWLHRKVIWP